MAETKEAMPMSDKQRIVVYWQDNQVAVTFLSNLPISEGPTKIIQSLHLDRLNKFLNSRGFNLTSFDEHDIPHPRSPDEEPEETLVQEGIEVLGKGIKAIGEGIEALGEKIEELGQAIIDRVEQKGEDGSHDGDDDDDNKGLNSPVGKYLFAAGSNTSVISFFHVARTNGDEADSTVEIVNLLNNPSTKATLKEQDVPDFTAMPNWLNGGTQLGPDFITHGCPVDPPYPVPVSESCNSGRWSITVESLIPDTLQVATGAGVRVFVLDTLPTEEQIKTASEGDPAKGVLGAGNNNMLLKDLVTSIVDSEPFNAQPPGININYQKLSDHLDDPNLNLPLTGKDIYERLVGFPVVDHGLFVAGIVRDLAPKATIECVRVLNDFGVGDTNMLTDALQKIVGRMADPKDLQNQRIVINLSLVATPADEDIIKLGFNKNKIDDVRAGLAVPFKLLSKLGVVFAASSGNDSSPTDPMNMSGCRYGPRYPAAFVYSDPNHQPSNYVPTMIPVGAVDKDGKAASYSNYPREKGIATYGGSLLIPIPKEPLNPPQDVTDVQKPIDALRGVYSSSLYPRLSQDDTAPFQSPPPPDYPEYPAPNPDAWAYWSGTSFASPIISALAARILELKSSGVLKPDVSVPQAIISSAGEGRTLWNRLQPKADGMCNEDCSEDDCVYGPLIMAFQECQSTTPPIQ